MTQLPFLSERLPFAGAFYPPARLQRQATSAVGLRYSQFAYWEERKADQVQRTAIEKEFTLAYESTTACLTYRALPPVLHKPAPTVLERVLLLLAQLYQHLELTVAPSGQLLALRNHAAIRRTWQATVQPALVQLTGGEDEITRIVLASVSEHLQEPARLLSSLSYEYAFAFLLPNFYEQRIESGYRYPHQHELPLFFANTSVWFQNYLSLEKPAAAGQVALSLRGNLDQARTDATAVAQLIDEALAASGSAAPATDPAALSGQYEAYYTFDQATGWPIAVEASACCQASSGYRKEYFIRLEQLPAA